MDGSSRPRAPQPAPPDRAFSFTDWQTNNPTAPPPGDKIDAELDRTNQAVEDVIEWVSTSLNSDGSLVEPPGTDPPPDDAAGPAEDWAVVSQAWAEHMPDTIPPNILAEMAITGEHWSARWWAKQAAQIVAGALSGAAVVSDTPPASPQQGQLWFDSVDAQLYVWYVDPNSAAWVIANADGGGPSASTVDVVSVRDYGAVGDGGTDDTAAISDAATAVNATGGTLYFPPGHYLVSAATPLASNVTVTGAGWASVLVVVYNFTDPGGWTGNCVFSNKNGGATSLTDQNIVIENLAFDASAIPSGGAFHHLRFRQATGIVVRGCSFLSGGDAVAGRACVNVQVINNTARSFTNCAWDFWEACTNVQVIGNYAETQASNQLCNFNSISGDASVGTTDMHADGCVVSGNVFNCTGTGSAVQIEPLGTSSTNSVKNVVVSGNIFKKVQLACRGNVDGIMISGNTFSDYTGNVSAIFCYPFFGGTPGTVQVCNNNFNNIHITNPFGVIRVEAPGATIVGNFVDGMGPTDGPCIYTGSAIGAIVAGNSLSNGSVVAPRATTSSHSIYAPNGKDFGTYDSTGAPLRFVCQGDDNFVWWGTAAGGAQRMIMSIYQHNSTSLLEIGPEIALAVGVDNNHVRIQGSPGGATPGNSPVIYPFGTDPNISMRIAGQGNSGALVEIFNASVPPTTTDIPGNFFAVWQNTTDGSVKLYVNLAGTLKSVALT